MRINHNIPALNTLNQLEKGNNKTAKAMERLSSGLRINSASDDAAGLAIANKMDAQVKGLRQANRNAMDGVSLVQTTEGALNEVHAMLQRMRELSVQAANGTNSDEDREKIQQEVDELLKEIDGISSRTQFNEMGLLNGGKDAGDDVKITLQIGANQDQTMTITIEKMNTETLALDVLMASGVSTQDNADQAIETIDAAIEKISKQRSMLGASQNRLEHTVNNLAVSEENLTASMSRIQDADMAQEMATFTQQNVLTQAANAMLAQANQIPQQVLQLLQR
ncbi:MAG: flagellin [Cellulosilyticaceae bacterium]